MRFATSLAVKAFMSRGVSGPLSRMTRRQAGFEVEMPNLRTKPGCEEEWSDVRVRHGSCPPTPKRLRGQGQGIGLLGQSASLERVVPSSWSRRPAQPKCGSHGHGDNANLRSRWHWILMGLSFTDEVADAGVTMFMTSRAAMRPCPWAKGDERLTDNGLESATGAPPESAVADQEEEVVDDAIDGLCRIRRMKRTKTRCRSRRRSTPWEWSNPACRHEDGSEILLAEGRLQGVGKRRVCSPTSRWVIMQLLCW